MLPRSPRAAVRRIVNQTAPPFDRADLDELLELNHLRAAGTVSPRSRELENRFATRFALDRRLAVYGSLAPGESNHAQVRHLAGRWLRGLSVRGERVYRGWGSALGYSALRWSLDGPPVAVQLFVSDDLPQHWARLDAFEGDDYLRIAVPVYADTQAVGFANVYAARESA